MHQVQQEVRERDEAVQIEIRKNKYINKKAIGRDPAELDAKASQI